jgi:hypothetical protein
MRPSEIIAQEAVRYLWAGINQPLMNADKKRIAGSAGTLFRLSDIQLLSFIF